MPDSLLEEAASYTVHPAFLDAWFQVLIAALPVDTPSGSRAGLYLPIGLSDFRAFGRPPRRVWSHARLRSDPGVPADICEGDVRVYDEAGALVAEALGLRLRRTGRVSRPAAAPDPYDDWLYELRWQPGTRRQGQPATASPGSWLIFNDRSGVGDALAAVLEDGGDTCYLVAPGDAFAREDGARFQVNPDRPGDVGQLIEAIREGDGDRSRCAALFTSGTWTRRCLRKGRIRRSWMSPSGWGAAASCLWFRDWPRASGPSRRGSGWSLGGPRPCPVSRLSWPWLSPPCGGSAVPLRWNTPSFGEDWWTWTRGTGPLAMLPVTSPRRSLPPTVRTSWPSGAERGSSPAWSAARCKRSRAAGALAARRQLPDHRAR